MSVPRLFQAMAVALPALVLAGFLAPTSSAHAAPMPTPDPTTGWHGRAIQQPIHDATTTATSTRPSRAITPGTGMATRHGSRAVRRLQRDLRQLGYRPGPVDGRYGPRTRGAVAWFQLKHGLDRTGAATARTLAHMRDRLRPTAATAAPADIIRPAAQSAQPVQPGTGPISLPSAGRGLSEVAVEIVLIALTGLGLGVIVGTYAQTRIRLGRPSRITGRLGNGVRS